MTTEEEDKVELGERLWGNLKKNGYRKHKKKEEERGSRGGEQRKNIWSDKYGGSHRKAKNDYRKGRDKNIQKRWKKSGTKSERKEEKGKKKR